MASVGERSDTKTPSAAPILPATPTGPALPPGTYFQQLLRLIQPVLKPRASVVWGLDENGVFAKVAELSTAAAQRPAMSADSARAHAKRLLDALTSTEPRVTTIISDDDEHSCEPEIEVLAPFHDGRQPCGVIELVVATCAEPEAEKIAAALQEFAEYASRYVRSLHVPPPEPSASSGVTLNRVALELHRHLSLARVALTAVNEGRLLLGYDRVSLATRRGQRTELLAVSGQEQIAARSSLVQALTELAAALLPAGKPLYGPLDLDALPPQVRQPLIACMAEGGALAIEALPLRRELPRQSDDEHVNPAFKTCGILIGEHFETPRPPIDRGFAEGFSAHVGIALANARDMERSWTPLKRLSRRLFAPEESPSARRTAMTCAVATAAIVILGMMPVRYRVEATGRLMPAQRRQVFAPSDAQVKDVLVAGNDQVTAGQVLLRLTNERLASDLVTARHQLAEQQKLLAALEAQSAEAQAARGDQNSIRLSGAIAQARIEAASMQARVEAIEGELNDLEIRSPIAGTVTTFDPRRALLSRPVARGEPLLEVMDAEGPWQLELDAPARRIGPILQAVAASDGAVPVEYALATEPDQSFTGALRNASSRIVVNDDAESVAPLAVDVVAADIEQPVAGAEVLARIDCGRRSLARVLLGDFIDSVRRRVW
jgi:multidrug efflux pump subunit AcrA (membrane-fusion protein)